MLSCCHGLSRSLPRLSFRHGKTAYDNGSDRFWFAVIDLRFFKRSTYGSRLSSRLLCCTRLSCCWLYLRLSLLSRCSWFCFRYRHSDYLALLRYNSCLRSVWLSLLYLGLCLLCGCTSLRRSGLWYSCLRSAHWCGNCIP